MPEITFIILLSKFLKGRLSEENARVLVNTKALFYAGKIQERIGLTIIQKV